MSFIVFAILNYWALWYVFCEVKEWWDIRSFRKAVKEMEQRETLG